MSLAECGGVSQQTRAGTKRRAGGRAGGARAARSGKEGGSDWAQSKGLPGGFWFAGNSAAKRGGAGSSKGGSIGAKPLAATTGEHRCLGWLGSFLATEPQ